MVKRINLEPRKCKKCGKLYTAGKYSGDFCSTACSHEGAVERAKKKEELKLERALDKIRRRDPSLTIGEINLAAKAAGMTYGNFVKENNL